MPTLEELEKQINQHNEQLGALLTQVTTLTSALADTQGRLQKAEREAVPVGTIEEYGGRYSDKLRDGGWLPCDGRPLSAEEYPELFVAIGQLWGRGNGGPRDFNLPPLGGKFLRGATSDPAQADLDGRTPLGDGAPTEVGSIQEDQFRSHEHSVSAALPHRALCSLPAGQCEHGSGFSGGGLFANNGATGIHRTADVNVNQVSRGGNETRPRNAYVTHIIKAGRQVILA